MIAQSCFLGKFGGGFSLIFDIVLEEIENAIEGLNQDGAEAFQKDDYERIRELMEKGSQMRTFRERVNELQKERGLVGFRFSERYVGNHRRG